MSFRKKLLGKILSLILALLLWFNPVLVPVAWAEGEEVPPQTEPQPTETQSEPTPTPLTGTNPVTPTPIPESTITTGDANAQAEVETTANTQQDNLPGEITTPPGNCTPPEGETSCPNDVAIENNNSAQVTDSASSSATTGENQITGSSGDATISTGDATASGTIENEANTNVVILEPSPTPTPELTGELTRTNPVTLTVENNNEGTVTNNANVTASTGENLASKNLGDAQIQTGDALAWANLLNFINTNIVASNFEVLLLDLLEGQNGNINLNKLWKEILEKGGQDALVLAGESSFSNLQLLVQNQNQANLENNVNVSAGTGENQANENNNAEIQTGDATALANVTNIINTNILGSQFFFGVINVLGSFEGNLILPRPERIAQEANSQGISPAVIFENQNEAEIQDQVLASAQTGENEETNNKGDNIITTGSAKAVANTFSLVNLNIFRNNWFFLLINNLGNWQGKIFGWSASEAVEEQAEVSQIFQLGMGEEATAVGQNLAIEQDLPFINFENQNKATVKNNISSSASTGQNQANENQGDAQIKTGKATALSNLVNFVNTNILGGRFFFGLVNVLGNWRGDTVFAYPDVTVLITDGQEEVSPGETFEYSLIYKNQGDDEAKDVVVTFELPEGLTFLGDSSGFSPEISGNTYSWLIGSVEEGKEGGFNVQVQVEPDFTGEEKISLLERLIPKVYAAENEASVTVEVSIGTVDPESNTGNNTASETTIVYFPIPEEEKGGEDNRLPALEISAWNNVNEFVYPGDTVTFEITIKNKGRVLAYDVILTQELFNGLPEEDFGKASFEIGDLEPGKGGKLSFGLALADDGVLPSGPYYTIAQATGFAPNRTPVSSNQARTDFEIRHKVLSSLFEAKAVGKEDENEILGVLQSQEKCDQDENLLPYVLFSLLSSLWLVQKSRRYLKSKA